MRSRCAGITTPTLLLRATRDRLVTRQRHEELRCSLPHASVAEIEGPHRLLQARPVECAEAIMRFVASGPEATGYG
jgi:pimeloyl-[acyl-carrier protein] methyl ester esterase